MSNSPPRKHLNGRATLSSWWRTAHRWPRWKRWPLKMAALTVVLLLVLFPRPWVVPTWLTRMRHMNGVLDATHPGLAALEVEVRAAVAGAGGARDVPTCVEEVVCAHVPYAFDWETWGVVDWLPTVAEVFAAGREDCDGRAVVAASLLRRMGHETWLVGDLKHVWVVTRAAPDAPAAELMGPGTGEKSMVGAASGTGVALSFATLENVGRALRFGVAVFPVGRELVLVGAVCLLSMQPRSSPGRRIGGCVLLVGALGILRATGVEAATPILAWVGVASALAGWLLLVVPGRAGR
jgi:hypothetical protein